MAEYIEHETAIDAIKKNVMVEYIKKQDALGVFHDWSNKEGELVSAKETSEYKAIENIPAADVQPVVHGKWIKNEGIGVRGVGWHCSVCKENDVWAFIDKDEKTQDDLYCPNCGAKMDGEV